MKRLFLLFLLSAKVFTVSLAQDIIYIKDNTEIKAKVLEISTDKIKYKAESNPDGPTYVIDKADAVMIIYQNGKHEIISVPRTVNYSNYGRQRYFDSLSIHYHRNILMLNLTDFLIGSVSFGYEHIFSNGKYALKVPLSIGLSDGYGGRWFGGYGYPFTKTFSTGAEFKIYPNGQGQIKYYLSALFEYGEFKQTSYLSNTYIYSSHVAMQIKNGLNCLISRDINLSLDVGIGIKQDEEFLGVDYYSYFRPTGSFNLSMGYRF